MKKLVYLLLFIPFLSFSQSQIEDIDCDSNDVLKEVYLEGNQTILKCTDQNGHYVLHVIAVRGSGGGSGSGGADTGMSDPLGPEYSPPPNCINTWIKTDGEWLIVNYCGIE